MNKRTREQTIKRRIDVLLLTGVKRLVHAPKKRKEKQQKIRVLSLDYISYSLVFYARGVTFSALLFLFLFFTIICFVCSFHGYVVHICQKWRFFFIFFNFFFSIFDSAVTFVHILFVASFFLSYCFLI